MPGFSFAMDPECASRDCMLYRMGMENELQQLREKLAGSQLQIESLNLERDQLHEQLREAKFRDRSSISPTLVPSLPDEILDHIFALATCFEGLACPAWDNTAGSGWKISSLTRRCIPLVSRRWHAIGLKFLYEHVTLRSGEQISSLLHALNRADTSVRERRVGWIRGLEFDMPNVSLQSIISEFDVNHGAEVFVNFEKLALRLLQILPEGRLRRLGVDCGACEGLNTQRTTSIAIKGLAKSQGQLEMFHISCAEPTQEELPDSLGRIHTLSRLSRRPCTLGSRVGFFANLGTSAHSIRKALLGDDQIANFVLGDVGSFLRAAGHLNTLYIRIKAKYYSRHQLKHWLEGFPQLRCLHIHTDALCTHASAIYEGNIRLAHPLLEEITIYLETGTKYQLGLFIPDLMRQIESVNLPKFRRITIHGNFPDGCLDAHRIFWSNEYRCWAKGLDWCALQGVAVINHEGHAIHLWRRRHSPKLEASGESDSSGSEGEQWFERSDTDSFLYASEGAGDRTDDSDYAPYRYVYRPDIEQVNSDSE